MKIRVVMRAAVAVSAVAFNQAEVCAFSPKGFAAAQIQSAELLRVQDSNGLFRGIGVVTAIDPKTGSLTVNHQEIAGLMPPMEMLFNVSQRSLSDGVRPGDKIEFHLENKTYTIRDLKVIEHTK
jgi:Cu/Ag efflux protein CusF